MIHELPEKFRILIVDDEPDIHAVTKLSLRGLKFHERETEILSAETGTEAIEIVRNSPDIAVILLDVVMESDNAGLDACRTIREDFGNRTVRILLRTGQPGQAPEKETIENYDIDGYLAKAEIDANRLYSAVRAALKGWQELIQLERHQHYLSVLHTRAVGLHSYDPLPETLAHILEAALEICPADLGILELQTFEENGNPQRNTVHLSTKADQSDLAGVIDDIRAKILSTPQAQSGGDPVGLDSGLVVPLNVHRELGYGWLYLAVDNVDDLAQSALTLLAGHAANALYSTVAEAMLAEQEESIDALAI